MPGSFTNVPGTPSVDELIARWEERTGIRTQHREWYRAFQLYKMAVIGLVGARLFDDGHSDDLRFNDMAYGVPWLTALALTDLGIEEELEPGPLFPRGARRRGAAEGGPLVAAGRGRPRPAPTLGVAGGQLPIIAGLSWVEHPFDGRADAAVDEDVGAGEVARIVGHEERDQVGHFARRTHARDRRVVEHDLHHRLLFEFLT